ncbi:MAG TPA: type II toxin-antitoxin system RelE/ParE family toxin [Thermodesulfovibrionia bacterium]|nr:type II toxin-antitoxin system RelE/ParE family toxin [Thermodesulfovibrionia bacterium]
MGRSLQKNYKIIISTEAENDLKDAFSWYENIREGLGHDFLLQIEAALKFIKRNPKVLIVEYKGTRKLFVKKFPYKIIYIVDAEKINIIAVIHGKRNTNFTKKRIDTI